MSRFESDPAGLGVGKRYGPLDLGGVAGVTSSASGEYRMWFEISAAELEAAESYGLGITDKYGRITDVYVEVEEEFDAGTVDVLYKGTTVLPAPVALTAQGLIDGALAAPVTVSGLTSADDNLVSVDVAGVTGTAGFAKVVVEFQRV